MKQIGTIIQVLPVTEGESNSGRWVRGGIVIETNDEYPVKMAFSVFGEERVEKLKGLQVGEPVEVYFTPVSREFNDKWYTDLRASQVNGMTAQQTESRPSQAAAYPANPAPSAPAVASTNPDDDLPF